MPPAACTHGVLVPSSLERVMDQFGTIGPQCGFFLPLPWCIYSVSESGQQGRDPPLFLFLYLFRAMYIPGSTLGLFCSSLSMNVSHLWLVKNSPSEKKKKHKSFKMPLQNLLLKRKLSFPDLVIQLWGIDCFSGPFLFPIPLAELQTRFNKFPLIATPLSHCPIQPSISSAKITPLNFWYYSTQSKMQNSMETGWAGLSGRNGSSPKVLALFESLLVLLKSFTYPTTQFPLFGNWPVYRDFLPEFQWPHQ